VLALLVASCALQPAKILPTTDAGADTDSLTLTATVNPDSTSLVAIHLDLTNSRNEVVYLPVCGPWEILGADDLRPDWFVTCEIDYLGHRVAPNSTFSDELLLGLEPGTYQARTQVYSQCKLGEPKTISATETFYGEFVKCAVHELVVSPPFVID
jgi:hypothetical protein